MAAGYVKTNCLAVMAGVQAKGETSVQVRATAGRLI